MFHSQEVTDYINGKLKEAWPPEQTACSHCELKRPSWRTLYRWIYEKYLVNSNLKVEEPWSERSAGEIQQREADPKKRQAGIQPSGSRALGSGYGVVSGRGKNKACFAALAERKTRFYIAVKIPDRKAGTMENAIAAVLSVFPFLLHLV